MAKRDAESVTTRVSDFVDYRDFFPEKIKLDDHPDTDFVIEMVTIRTDAERPYCSIIGSRLDNGDPVCFTCGGERVVRFFQNHNAPDTLPIIARFYKAGNAWIME